MTDRKKHIGKSLNSFLKNEREQSVFQYYNPADIDHIPQHSANPELAFKIVRNNSLAEEEHLLDFSSLSTTSMDKYADTLIEESASYNLSELEEDSYLADVTRHCINIIGNLWNSKEIMPVKTGAPASSGTEAAILGGVAAWLKWREIRKSNGEDYSTPNFIVGESRNIAWNKLSTLWQIEMRTIPMSLTSPVLDPVAAVNAADENTFMIVATYGSGYTGLNDDVEALGFELEKYKEKHGRIIPVHIDAALGGFIEPFVRPKIKWDFRSRHIVSISTSAHKFGLVYPSLGWIIWKDSSCLPDEMKPTEKFPGNFFHFPGLNIAPSASNILAQFYQFVRLGFDGYRAIHTTSLEAAAYLSEEIMTIPQLKVIFDGKDNPLVVFGLSADDRVNTDWSIYDLQAAIYKYGWKVPVYELPENMGNLPVMRMVLRQGVSMEMLKIFLSDVKFIISEFENI